MSGDAGILTRRRSYTVVFNDSLPEGAISARAWGLYVYLIGRPDGWVTRVAHLQTVFTEGRDAIYTALGQLVDAGLMERETYSDSGLLRTRYVLAERCPPTAEDAAAPDTGFQDAGNPAPDMPEPLTTTDLATTDVVKDPLTSSLRSEVTPPGFDDADALFQVPHARSPQTKKGPTALPADWTPSPAELAWAQAKIAPTVDVAFETRKFTNHFTGKRKTDWARTWRNWMLNAEKYAAQRGNGRRAYSDDESWGPREVREAEAAQVRETWAQLEADTGRRYSPEERDRMQTQIGRVIPDA